MSDTDPERLAESLPNRPLGTDEIVDLAERLGCSVSQQIHETQNGTEYVPMFFLFDPVDDLDDDVDVEIGDALVLRMNDEMTDWIGETEREEITQETWVKATEIYNAEMGGDLSLRAVWSVDETGEVERERQLRNRDDEPEVVDE